MVMKKFMFAIAAMSICAAAFAAPVMDDDDVIAPKKVEKAFQKMYPGAQRAEWELKRDVYVAEFKIDGKDIEAWFNADGTWMRSKEDVSQKEVPAEVKKTVKDTYPGWRSEDYELVTDARGYKHYVVELEKEGEQDKTVRISPNGKILQMPERGGHGRPGMKPGESHRIREGAPEQGGGHAEFWKHAERNGGEIVRKARPDSTSRKIR